MASEITPIQAYDGKSIDRTPQVKAAGNLTNFGSSVADCLFIAEREPYGYVKRFLNDNIHPVGHTTQWPARASDFCIANKLCHGVPSFSSQPVEDLIYPHQMTTLEYVQHETAEKTYRGKNKAPLGKAPIFNPPPNFNTCGKVIESSATVFDSLHYPQELLEDVNLSGKNKVDIGEHVNRNYNQHFSSDNKFGMSKPTFEDGRQIKNIMYENSVHDKNVAVSLPLEVYRFKNSHKLGEGLQSQCDVTAALLDKNHTFGINRKKSEGSLIDEIRAQHESEINNVKQVVKTACDAIKDQNFDKFDAFTNVCKYLDKGKNGRISLLDMKLACKQVEMPISNNQLKILVERCGLYSSNNSIDYAKLRRIIDPSQHFETGETNDKEKQDSCPENSEKITSSPKTKIQANPDQKINQILTELTTNQSSAQDINLNIAKLDLKAPRKFGIPMVRSDHPPPIQKRLDDFTNYGDEPDARSLLYPSIYTRNGLSKEDCLKPRSKNQLFEIFKHVDPRMDEVYFEKVWKIASDSSCDGGVSVEGIKNALKSV